MNGTVIHASRHRLVQVALAISPIPGCFSPYGLVMGWEATSTDTTSTANESSTSTLAMESTTTANESTSGAIDPETTTSTTGDPGCTSLDGTPDPSCADTTPYCQAGACVSCTALLPDHCTSLDAATPYCDPELGVCTPCSTHAHCPGGACRIHTGECFSADHQLWVDGDSSRCAAGDGSPLAPFCTVVDALDAVATRPAGEAWMVKVAGQPEPYIGTLVPAGNHPLAIVGQLGNQRARLDGDGPATIDLLTPNLELYLYALDIHYTGPSTQTLRCAFGNFLWASEVNVLDGPALVLANCSVSLESTLVQGGDVRIGPQGGSLVMVDSIIEQGADDELLVRADAHLSHGWLRRLPGGTGVRLDDETAYLTLDNVILQGDPGDPVLFVDTGRFEAAFSTIVGGIGCMSPGPSSIRSSIVTGLGCGSISIDDSLVDAGGAQGTGNVLLPMGTLPALFVDPSGALGDYHVLPDSPAKDVGTWTSDDALFDIDGDARVGRVDAHDYAGADVP